MAQKPPCRPLTPPPPALPPRPAPPRPPQTNHSFIKAVTPHLAPVLLEQLTKQEEGQEQDEAVWNLAMSAGTCLGLTARVAGNDVVPVVRAAAGAARRRGGGLAPLLPLVGRA